MKLVIHILIYIIVVKQSLALAKKTVNSTFVATTEWQEVSEGQGIPAGLHVRINLQTGKKEAKLLDESEYENVAQSGTNLALDYKDEQFQPSKLKHKSYEELKQTFNEMRKNFRTDAEVIVQLIGEYHNLSKTEREERDTPLPTAEAKYKLQLQILDNFNYLVHQIDNAVLFVDNAGLEHVLLPLVVNETNIVLRVSAMRVLGALTQNNPKVQIKVYERNFGAHLSQILMTSSHNEELSTALYAFGSLLRKFPHAQLRILSTSGMHALVGLLTKPDCELKTKAKAAALISDLVYEKRMILDPQNNVQQPGAVAQYALLDYDEWLHAHGYCDALIAAVTSAELLHLLEQPEQMEHIVVSFEQTKSLCQQQWSQSAELRHALLKVKHRYMQSGNEYRLEVAQQIDNLCQELFKERAVRDEF